MDWNNEEGLACRGETPLGGMGGHRKSPVPGKGGWKNAEDGGYDEDHK